MSRPIVICCAITGSRPRKADNPAVPVSPAEQIESAHEAFEAGATVLHLHVRDEQERPCFLPERFAVVMEGVYEHCPGMIIELSTGGVAGSPADRAASLPLRPDMAAIALGSVNFPNGVYHNPPEVIDELARTCADLHIKPCIEVFDLSMVYTARTMCDQGLLREPLHFHIVLGGQGALPARRQVLDFIVAEIHNLFPDSTWMASGLGRHQDIVMDWALYLGGHIRTGLEDNIRITRDELVASNAQLVRRAADRCMNYGFRAASVAEARKILGLPSVPDR